MEYKTIAELLESPDRWHQGDYAATNEGDNVEANNPHASKWCLMGAVIRVYGADSLRCDEVLGILQEEVYRKYSWSVTSWNDAPERNHAEVLALVKELGI